ncbi:response regulator [Sinomicrobium kalidii]|uniref:hybrid sensor histidine kinase/response regulator transcription factor n=1 Tax=Sinomicrobium kalidii TaxID=2900738 RepID=UPI001E3B4AE9|nr:hybrid sensor histidine kinase/response regulator transcription factor [Sinomicrobium kalidii]UGU15877.1 response regulator [Sinomicrobium kalidii]
MKTFSHFLRLMFAVSKHILLLLVLFPARSVGQEMEFEKVTAKDGLSHSTVYDITQDDTGIIWFGTREGLNSYNGSKITTYYHDPENEKSINSNQINVVENLGSGLYIGTGSGLDKFEPETHSFKHILTKNTGAVNTVFESGDRTVFVGTAKGLFTIDREEKVHHYLKGRPVKAVAAYKTNVFWAALNRRILLINNFGEIIKEYGIPESPYHTSDGNIFTINTLFKDREGSVWAGTSRGLFYFDKGSDSFRHVTIGNSNKIEGEVIRSIDQDAGNNLWLGTESGIFVYDKETGTMVNYYTQSFSEQPETLSDKSVYSIFISKEQIVWIGTYFGGVNYTNPKSGGIVKYFPSDYKNSIGGKAVSQIVEMENGAVWMGTEDGGVSILDRQDERFRFLNTEDGLSSNNVHSLEEDSRGNIWIGTFLGGLNRYEKETGEISVFKFDKNDKNSLSNNCVYAIREDHDGRLWVGTQFGLNIYDYDSKKFSLYKAEVLGDKFVYDILEDSENNLWFCTRRSGVYKRDAETGKLTHPEIASGTNSGKKGQIVSAYEDSKGNIWFGSLNQGVILHRKNGKNLEFFKQNKKLPNSNTYGILEDDFGKIWISTNKGLSIYNPETGDLDHLGIEDGLTTNQFNFKSAFRDNRGMLYFGSVNGLNVIDPKEFNGSPGIPDLEFTGFQLFNQEVPVTGKGVLQKHINYQDKITLNHEQDVISIAYGAISYSNEGAVKYAYKLDGFDDSWNEVGTKTTAVYTNLSPGDYTFRVRTLPLSLYNERKITLTVLPPFWKTDMAYCIYVLLILLMVYAYWRFVRFVHNQKLALQMERLEKEKINELNRHKLNFFTFISHEFKTPLTLIIASAEKFFREKVNMSAPPEELLSIKKNAGKLNQLIHQLLEFRKIETEHAKLELKKGDIIVFLKDTFEAFSPLFEAKGIEHDFCSDIQEYTCYFDPSKVEMITTNLISNALKNTPDGGTIHLELRISSFLDKKKRSRISLEFTDTGAGMSAAVIAKVTEPFYKLENEGGNSNSGLGLALVKSLTDFLEGKLDIRSEPGEGTTVCVDFPLILKVKDEANTEKIDGNKSLNVTDDLIHGRFETMELSGIEKKNNLKMLIVEDNVELMKFLQRHFTSRFRVITAKDGEKALEKLKHTHPDIIISDVKMPGLSGIQFCKSVKSDPDTRHIPLLLLTAKNSDNLKIDALASGANVYLTKPFNLKELDLLVTNLLETGKNLEKRFSEINATDPEHIPANNQEREFLRKISSLVEQYHSNPGFGVESLASEAGISRSLLHIKMKKITGLSALDYIKRIRMKKATRLIREGKNISEVAYKVGYSDPNYFSRAFKKEFHVTPTQFAEQK